MNAPESQVIAPACLSCDDRGVMPGQRALEVALCKCEAGNALRRASQSACDELSRHPYRSTMPADQYPLDARIQDLGLLVARLAHALALVTPQHELIRQAEQTLTRNGMLSGVDYKALDIPRKSLHWPKPDGQFNTDRRDDPHNPSNRANPLNQHRRRSDKEE